MRALLPLFLSCCFVTEVNAQVVAAPRGDYYMRSEHTNGAFNGIHQLLTQPRPGYIRAVYCDRAFYVSTTTVLWSEQEAEAGRRLVIESNYGRGRELFCEPEAAMLKAENLGISPAEVEEIREEEDPPTDMRNRLRTIRDAFKDYQ
ncbi:hypothetical protein JM93_00618 [Roseibium hamelinense]|uniref:Uncharacterized protein n=1 Tax=Roseibium hamelinense TaxID=150831 RepID=A0A562TIH0_9HYPH|nr:hypothetical protein [Roseibium hamelinense]MTI45753.1 hypothetical protein [Roseibium hamelinense]TWI93064.1 hypothetical protein JM93_00618 [Roseibium hamelinense]